MQEAYSIAESPRDLRRQRVLIVTQSLSNGGMERQLALLAKSLPDTWEVRVVGLSDGVFAGILREEGVDLTVLPRAFPLDFRPAFPLRRIIRSWRPAVVHTYGWISTAAAYPACRSAEIPLVDASIRDGAMPERRGRVMRVTTSLADVVIANSRAGLDAFGIDEERGRVVRNGFDPARWALCDRESREVDTTTTVVMTARMNRQKDFRTLIDAVRVLDKEEPGAWRFWAVGSGEDREALVSVSLDLVDLGIVTFPDAGQEVLGLVKRADVGVLLTNAAHHAEGISNSIMEYMACGLPVVCTDSGGSRELVIEGQTGLLVAPGDVSAVVEQLRYLRGNPDVARRMGEAGRERIASAFTVDALVLGTVEAYELARSRRGISANAKGRA